MKSFSKSSRAPATWKCIWIARWWIAAFSPSLNIESSGTRKEELLYHPDEYNKVVVLRRALTGVPPVEAMELMLNKLKKTGSNIEFLLSMGVT